MTALHNENYQSINGSQHYMETSVGKMTSSNDYVSRYGTDNLAVGIFLVIVFICFLIIIYFLWKHFICKNYNTCGSITTLYAPQFRAFHRSRSGHSDTSVLSLIEQHAFSSRSVSRDDTNDLPRRGTAEDRPPNYYEVIVTDSNARCNKLSEVPLQMPETPPPEYEDSKMRY